jgi:hypothetical protein
MAPASKSFDPKDLAYGGLLQVLYVYNVYINIYTHTYKNTYINTYVYMHIYIYIYLDR